MHNFLCQYCHLGKLVKTRSPLGNLFPYSSFLPISCFKPKLFPPTGWQASDDQNARMTIFVLVDIIPLYLEIVQ